MHKTMSIKILLADDHVVLRQGLSRSLQTEKDMEIVGHANDGHTAVKLCQELAPDVVVMDISMPDLNGIEATRQIAKTMPKSKIIGLSMHSTKKFVMEMFKAGASGYLLKDCEFDELVTAIRTVASGKTYICPAINDILITSAMGDNKGEIKSAFSALTQREREVLQLLSEGKTTKQIANVLHISPKTVEVHRLNIMNKLEIDNIAQLTKYAIQEGLTMPEL
jgi:two-component system, NarL family, response regulator NreC